MKSKEWLKDALSDGQTLTGEVLAELLDSLWHKSEMGSVAQGDEQPVSGGAVADALTSMLEKLSEKMQELVEAAVDKVLADKLADYLTKTAYDDGVEQNRTAERQWVTNQVADLVKKEEVAESLAQRTSAIYDEVDSRLEPYAKTADVSENYALKTQLPDMTTVALKSELPDVSTLVQKTDYNTAIVNINTAIAAKTTAADVATAKQEAIDIAAANTSNVCALPSEFDANGVYIGKQTVNS